MVFSYIGYQAQEVKINGRSDLTIKMVEDSKALEEVVVVGYTTQKKATITGSVSTITTKDLKQSPTANLNNALAGRMPGLMVNQFGGGEPGVDRADLRIRGMGTYGDKSPIVIVDGVERDMSYLAPEDRNEKEFKPTPSTQNKLFDTKKRSASEIISPIPSLSPIPSTTQNLNIQPSTENNMPQASDNINENNAQTFNSFDDNQKMAWPVFGEIVMDYDNENLVYDKTLEQYRTNDCISLSAQIGEQVKATADGIVKLITNTPESGNTIVIDHGNNWTTTYSQLQDDLLVNEGDFVKKGQVIGGVNAPTKYGILLGSHLDFKVSHEDNPVDPKLIMAEK